MKIKLLKVEVNKFKSIQNKQTIAIDPYITTIVGMNESGKTSFLEAIAKTNYFKKNKDFTFNKTYDYPRNELIDFEESAEDCEVVKCHYQISNELLKQIAEDVGDEVFLATSFTHSRFYKKEAGTYEGIKVNTKKFLELKTMDLKLSAATKENILKLTSINNLSAIVSGQEDEDLEKFKAYINDIIAAGWPGWSNALESYIVKKWLDPGRPKFWYFDDYYILPGKINIQNIIDEPTKESNQTAKALFELAKINPNEILQSTDYERFIALLEASSNKITSQVFKYWSTNRNLDIEFKIQDLNGNKHLDIRVKSHRHKISLPLDRRSKGFNWFFSFIVWFSKIQADKNSDYILLLDEPGLNLHASAQADLLTFIEDLAKNYQVIYTTHSPFMVDSQHLERVKTCLETENGTIISDSLQEKDPNTLFPLQAALGYDIAQNLFISKKNLLVEGPADLLYLTVLSTILEANKREGLKDNITIVPVGGLDKVSTFISLLRGQNLDIVCLLDSFTDQKGKQRLDDLVVSKIIKEKNIFFFNKFTLTKEADIEDIFKKEDYLKLFNAAFEGEFTAIELKDLDSNLPTIIKQINKAISKERFNHFRPAYKLSQLGVDIEYFSVETLNNFETIFKEINKLFTK